MRGVWYHKLKNEAIEYRYTVCIAYRMHTVFLCTISTSSIKGFTCFVNLFLQLKEVAFFQLESLLKAKTVADFKLALGN